tara:strand:- start:91 stop:915 length:825 start_codon:yes stop_codon:yes gene_type:complete
MTNKNNFKLAIPTDAISMDIETSFLIGLDWGINSFELKRLFNKRLSSFEKSDIEYIKNSVKKNNTKICSLSPGIFKGKIDSDLTLKEIDNFDKIINYTEEFNADKIIVFGFDQQGSDNSNKKKIISQIVSIYENLLEKCIKKKITLLVENDRGHFANNKDILVEIFKYLPSDYFKINWDPCNCIGEKDSELPFPNFYNLIKDKIGHLHIKDAISHGEKFKNIMLGKGEVNWKDQITALKKDNYSGYYVIEPHFGHRIHSTYDHIKSFRKIYNEA